MCIVSAQDPDGIQTLSAGLPSMHPELTLARCHGLLKEFRISRTRNTEAASQDFDAVVY